MPLSTIYAKVCAVLNGRNDWRSELARRLALELDVEPNASMAKELRGLMAELEDAADTAKGTPLDELSRRRASR